MHRLPIMLLTGLLGLMALSPLASAKEHEVMVVNNEFQPASLTIAVGDTVRFEWPDGSTNHNVAQVDDENDDTYDSGFRSGDAEDGPTNWTLPASYSSADATLYYICEPHVSLDMRGKIIVGNGGSSGDDDDDSDSPGFSVVGLIAAAGVAVYLAKRQ